MQFKGSVVLDAWMSRRSRRTRCIPKRCRLSIGIQNLLHQSAYKSDPPASGWSSAAIPCWPSGATTSDDGTGGGPPRLPAAPVRRENPREAQDAQALRPEKSAKARSPGSAGRRPSPPGRVRWFHFTNPKREEQNSCPEPHPRGINTRNRLLKWQTEFAEPSAHDCR